MNNKSVLISSTVLIITLLILTEPFFEIINQGFFAKFESNILEPLFFFSISYSAVSLFLLFFPEKIFQLWLHRIASWFLPISVILIWTGSDGNEYASLDRTSVSIVLGVTLLIISVVFVFIQRFYYKPQRDTL
jgi:hypothetical protein